MSEIQAVDAEGTELHVGDRVSYLDVFSSGSATVEAISEEVNRVGEQFGGYEYRGVKISGFGWVNPVARLRKQS